MQLFGNEGFTNFLITALCVLFAIAFQIQTTLFASPTYIGLRVSMADLLIPFAALGILYTLIKHQSSWPVWSLKHMYLWLAGLTFVLFAALMHTHFTFGEISHWALVNKFGGWIILMTLLGVGGWVGTNASETHIRLFLKTSLYFMLAVMAFDIFIMVAQSYPMMQLYIGHNIMAVYPIDGLMANKNVYALLYIAIVCLATCIHLSGDGVMKPRYSYVLYTLMPFFLLFNGSRAMMMALCIILPLIFIFYPAERKKIALLILSFILGTALLVVTFQEKDGKIYALLGRQFEFIHQFYQPLPAEQTDQTYPGDDMRLTILEDTKELFKERPVTGSGLGSTFSYQKEKHGKIINLIDSTPLWLAIETGLAGLFIFIGFYIRATGALVESWKKDEDLSKTFRTALIGTLIGFTLMSVFHELLYTRFIWFLLGLGLTLPSRMRQSV